MKSIKLGLVTLAVVSLGLSACASGGNSSSSKLTSQAASGLQATTQASHANKNISFDQLQRMAQSGDADAQYAIGYRFYYGIGVKQNTESSLSWMSQAASQGQKQALQALRLIKQANASQGVDQAATSQASKSEALKKINPIAAKLTRKRDSRSQQVASQSSATIPGFTLQLMGTHDKQSLIDFIVTHNLQDKATYYRRSYDGQDWYVLVSGRYSSQQDALDAISRLPESLKSMNPWVKPLGLVKQEMQS